MSDPFDRTKLAADISARAGISSKLALEVVNEFFDYFICLKKRAKDWDAELLSPSPLIDLVWHRAILHTKKYKALCGRTFIHHNPDGAQPQGAAARLTRYKNTLRAFDATFGRVPNPAIWPPLTADETALLATGAGLPAVAPLDYGKRKRDGTWPVLTKKTAKGNTFFITVSCFTGGSLLVDCLPTTVISHVLQLVSAHFELDAGKQRVLFDGNDMDRDKALGYYNIIDGDTIDVVPSQTGC
jgi:hypothetical protein